MHDCLYKKKKLLLYDKFYVFLHVFNSSYNSCVVMTVMYKENNNIISA